MSSYKARTHILALTLALLAGTCASAQTPTPVPVPSNFATAHTTFLASAGAPDLASREKEGVSIIYSSMYRALLASNLYHLQPSPSNTDLSMSVSAGEISSDFKGNSMSTPFVRLSIRDTKTQSLLWNIDEPISGAWREKSFEKNADICIAHIIVDLKQLAAGTIPGTNTSTSQPGAPQSN